MGSFMKMTATIHCRRTGVTIGNNVVVTTKNLGAKGLVTPLLVLIIVFHIKPPTTQSPNLPLMSKPGL